MSNPADQAPTQPSLAFKLVNLALLTLVIVLSVVAFFAALELLLSAAAKIIVRTVDSDVRGNYTLVFVRNIWLLAGGALLVGFVIGGAEYFIKRSREAKTRRRLLRILIMEVIVIGLSFILSS